MESAGVCVGGTSSALSGVWKSSVGDVAKGLSDEVGRFKQEAAWHVKLWMRRRGVDWNVAEYFAFATYPEVFGWLGETEKEKREGEQGHAALSQNCGEQGDDGCLSDPRQDGSP